jgi:magnesium chelatase subunit I
VFREYLLGFDFSAMLEHFDRGEEVASGDLVAAEDLLEQADDIDLAPVLLRLGLRGESPGDAASALEFAMEGLHLTRRLNKSGASYGG